MSNASSGKRKREGGTFYFEGNFEKARETLPGSHRDLSLFKESKSFKPSLEVRDDSV